MKTRSNWYVYELVNPITDIVFYVGKGSRDRIDAHEREAANGVCSDKCNHIRSIVDSGFKILKNKCAYFWDEQAAYDHETDRIMMYGLENLTNKIIGGQRAWNIRLEKRELGRHITPMENIKKHVGQFAFWLRHSQGGRAKMEINFDSTIYGINYTKAICEIFWNDLAKRIFKEAADIKSNHKPIKKLFAPYGLEIQFGI